MGEQAKPALIVDPWSDIDQRFKVRFTVPGRIMLSALLPETFEESVSSKWTTPFESIPALNQMSMFAQVGNRVGQALKGSMPSALRSLFDTLLGDSALTFRAKELTTQFWTGASPLTIGGLDVVFLAREDAKKDVFEPARMLQSMALSRTEAGSIALLTVPRDVRVDIGNMLALKHTLIKGVTIKWSNIQDENGFSTYAVVSLRVETRQAYAIEQEEGEKEFLFKKSRFGSDK